MSEKQNNLEKIEKIEFNLSYQEDIIDKLNEMVTSQQLQINKLEQQTELLQEAIKKVISQTNSGLELQESSEQQYELPPHF